TIRVAWCAATRLSAVASAAPSRLVAERVSSPSCPPLVSSPLAAQRTRGRLGGGALGAAGWCARRAPLPNPPLRLRRKGGGVSPSTFARPPLVSSPLAAQRTRGRLGGGVFGAAGWCARKSTPPQPSPAPA